MTCGDMLDPISRLGVVVVDPIPDPPPATIETRFDLFCHTAAFPPEMGVGLERPLVLFPFAHQRPDQDSDQLAARQERCPPGSSSQAFYLPRYTVGRDVARPKRRRLTVGDICESRAPTGTLTSLSSGKNVGHCEGQDSRRHTNDRDPADAVRVLRCKDVLMVMLVVSGCRLIR